MRRWWGRQVEGLPRAFWVLWTGQLVNRLGFFVEPFLALYLVRGRGISTATAGLVVAALGAGSVISQPLGGYLADRVGRRVTLTGGLLANAVTVLALGAATRLPLIVAGAVLLGLALDIYRPASAALVADLVAADRRPQAFALLYWASNVGVSVSAVLGGVLAEQGFWWLFGLDALTCVLCAGVVWRGIPPTRSGALAPHLAAEGWGVVLRDRLLLGLTAATFLGAVVYLQGFVALPLAMQDDGRGPSAYGLAYATNPVLVIIASPLLLPLLRRARPVTVYVCSALLLGVGFASTAFVSTTTGYAVTVGVWTLGEIGNAAVAPTLVAAIAPAHLRGRYNGTIGVAFGAAAVVGPIVGTLTLANLGSTTLWLGCLAVAAAGAAVLVVLGPALRRRTGPSGAVA